MSFLNFLRSGKRDKKSSNELMGDLGSLPSKPKSMEPKKTNPFGNPVPPRGVGSFLKSGRKNKKNDDDFLENLGIPTSKKNRESEAIPLYHPMDTQGIQKPVPEKHLSSGSKEQTLTLVNVVETKQSPEKRKKFSDKFFIVSASSNPDKKLEDLLGRLNIDPVAHHMEFYFEQLSLCIDVILHIFEFVEIVLFRSRDRFFLSDFFGYFISDPDRSAWFLWPNISTTKETQLKLLPPAIKAKIKGVSTLFYDKCFPTKVIKELKSLRSLVPSTKLIRSCMIIPAEKLFCLAESCKLKRLNFLGEYTVPEKDFMMINALNNLKHLKSLTFMHSSFFKKFITVTLKIPSLRSLEFSCLDTSTSVKELEIGACTNLRVLKIRAKRFMRRRVLKLTYSKILEFCNKFERLHTVVLKNIELTDHALDALTNTNESICYLTLHGCVISTAMTLGERARQFLLFPPTSKIRALRLAHLEQVLVDFCDPAFSDFSDHHPKPGVKENYKRTPFSVCVTKEMLVSMREMQYLETLKIRSCKVEEETLIDVLFPASVNVVVAGLKHEICVSGEGREVLSNRGNFRLFCVDEEEEEFEESSHEVDFEVFKDRFRQNE